MLLGERQAPRDAHGVDPELVLRAAQTGQLGALIQARSGRKVAQRGIARLEHLYRRRELAARLLDP